MNSDQLTFDQSDLSNCDREAVHLAGAIQPHGLLLVADRADLAILQVAGDPLFLLGVEPKRIFQLTLMSLFDDATLDILSERLRIDSDFVAPSILLGVRARNGSLPLHLTMHADGPLVLLEIEPARRGQARHGDAVTHVKAMLSAIQSACGISAYCQAAAAEVRAATGFGRVMIYRFLDDGSGAIIAEDREPGIDSFLGLHYPASDIPRQARALLRLNSLRLTPNIDYEPAPLTPRINRRTGAELDMSHCSLRSGSLLHLEYLRNMGVGASLTMSIMHQDRLWGMIACHHEAPRYLAADLRTVCELFVQIFSLHLEAKVAAEAAALRMAARAIQEDLVRRVALAPAVGRELTRDTALLDLVGADGAVVCFDGQLHYLGQVPPPEFIAQLVPWLNTLELPLFSSAHLAADFPPAASWARHASGLLAVSVSRLPKDYVLWFRAEVTRSVVWAGNPAKITLAGPHGPRLTPRKSFEAWQEELQLNAKPWDPVALEAAHALRITLLEVVLLQLDQARQEREKAGARQDLLMAELDHRVKNTLANIQALVQHSKAGKNSLEEFVGSLERRIRAMAHAHNLLSATRWDGATLRRLLEEELAPFYKERPDGLLLAGEDLMLTPRAALPFSMIIHELTSNAAKYGALSAPGGRITIHWQIDPVQHCFTLDWRESGGPPVMPLERRGFGTTLIERSVNHELNGTARLSFEPSGVLCSISIPTEHILQRPVAPSEHE